MPELLCKICGLTKAEDVALCHSLGADFIGFIFVPASPRFVAPEHAAALPDGPALRTGVFAGMELAGMRGIARRARLDFLQLHGGEEPALCRALGPERVIKTLWPEGRTPEEMEREMERFAPVCAYFLLDAGQEGGGSGKRLAADCLRHIRPPRPWLLAGGLGAENLAAALAAFAPGSGPQGVDLNSALESAPGIKDPALARKALALIHTCSGRRAGHIPEASS
ncbi:MAG: phosphoribosylanthranilate isomerase [Deltaproteobacteria bacterium]|jgi:phosphoribosylanthranilate isomerase|nr:phosphoribosylanthranilate isomerase [Deltaproteobacteria bacterium]